jgi:hypothetical protein
MDVPTNWGDQVKEDSWETKQSFSYPAEKLKKCAAQGAWPLNF